MSNDQHHHRNTWRAWVAANGKLHVHAEIYVADKSLFYQLDKQDPQGYYEDELMLVIKPKLTPGNQRVEVKFHEDLDSPLNISALVFHRITNLSVR